MARFIDFQRPVVLSSYADFERIFGGGPITREGAFRLTEVSGAWLDTVEAFLGRERPPATLSWGLSVEASQQIRTPCPSFWRHPIRWLRWNPLQTDTFLTKVQLRDVKFLDEDGEEIVSWGVDG